MSTSKIGSELNINVENNCIEDSYTDATPYINSSDESSKCRFRCAIFEKTSVHALSQLGQAKSAKCQLFWTVVLLLTTSGCIYAVNSFLTTFLQFQVLIDVEVKNRNTLEFPAVTVCNLNRLRNSHVKCVEKSLGWYECYYDALTRPQLTTRSPLLTEIKYLSSESNETSESEKNYKKRAREILGGYSILDAESRNCYGHRLHDLIKRCSFNSVNCKHTDFSYFYDKQYGNCYTFNKHTKVNKDSRSVKSIGPDSGLELVLNTEKESYADISPSAGVRVTIHSPQEDPNPIEHGINIMPGYESHISMFKISHHRLQPPYRDLCKNYETHDNFQTSQLTCTNECVQKNSMHKCGCVDPFLPNYQNLLLCNLVNATQMSCLIRVLEERGPDYLPCECPLPCASTIYDLRVTSNKWKQRDQAIDEFFGRTYDPYFCKQNLYRNTLESLTKLKVFFRSLDDEVYAQKPMYSDTELYSHLGGNLSLWLGLSFVAMYEFAENICVSLKNSCTLKN